MQVTTILNQIEKHKGFVYREVRLQREGTRKRMEIDVAPRRKSRPVCSVCGQHGPGYDTLPPRHFAYVPLWGIATFFVYAMRRVDCPRCGVKVEAVPWAVGKHPLVIAYAWFLAGWAKHLSWAETAQAFRTSWHHVFHSVEMAVEWGREHLSLEGVRAIGIDEMAWGCGHHYITAVYQIDEGRKRLLWVGEHRKAKTLLGFFHWFGPERTAALEVVCSDMWKAYLKVVAKKAGQALHILDRFHIMTHLNKAIDKVRAHETKELKSKGLEPVLTQSRWWFLKRPENLKEKQVSKLSEVLQYNLRTVRCYLMKEEFQFFWEYVSPLWAGRFLDQWCTRAMRSRIAPMQDVARMLRKHRELLLNWFRAKKAFSSGVVEGLNNKAKLTTRKAYGFRTFHALQIALYHTLGNLPVPELTHKFF